MIGKVKAWNSEKGIGYIDNGPEQDIIVTADNLVKCRFLKPGRSVSFDVAIANGRLRARKVKLAGEKPVKNRGQSHRQNQPLTNFPMS